MDNKEKGWKAPVLRTVALTGEGVSELVEKLEEHRCFLEGNDEQRMASLRAKVEMELAEAIKEKTTSKIVDELKKEGEFEELLRRILRKEIDPSSAADKLLQEKLRK